MTSAHSMFSRLIRLVRHHTPMRFACALTIVALTGCETREQLRTPTTLSAPYDQPQLWAVAPFTNESGVSSVRTDRIADLFTEQAEEIDGVSTIAVNRVIAAMRRMNMPLVASPADARSLMNVLGVDGLIVGTVTSYDPYNPPKFGAAVQLWRREATVTASINPTQITRATTDHIAFTVRDSNTPAAQASGVFDASNHHVLQWLDEYASGRTELNSAYGKRVYLVNMELYTQFVAYRLLHDVLESEHTALHPEAAQPQER